MLDDTRIALALSHTSDLLREAELHHLADSVKVPHPSLQNRLMSNLGEMLISGGEWLKSHGAPDAIKSRQN